MALHGPVGAVPPEHVKTGRGAVPLKQVKTGRDERGKRGDVELPLLLQEKERLRRHVERNKGVVQREAPLGDPMELRVRNYALSIRRADALRIEVE